MFHGKQLNKYSPIFSTILYEKCKGSENTNKITGNGNVLANTLQRLNEKYFLRFLKMICSLIKSFEGGSRKTNNFPY